MSETFHLKIYAADRNFFDGEAVSLVFPARDGEYQVLAHHENLVIATKEGIVRFRTEDDPENEICGIAGLGFVHILENRVAVLVDSIEYPDEIDRVRAERALARAKEQLRQDQSIQEYRISQASLARAMVRLSHTNGDITLGNNR